MTDDSEIRANALQARLEQLEATTTQRIIAVELKSAALRAGMVDLDGIRLIETNELALNDKGELEGAANLMTELRAAKPWLFSPPSTSAAAMAPPATPPAPRHAMQMTEAEWRAARTDLLRRR